MFTRKFFSLKELGDVFSLIDIYIQPNLDKQCASSGTLSFALGAGKPIIAFEFVHALEALADGRGIIIPSRNNDALVEAMLDLAAKPELRRQLAAKALTYGEETFWPKIGKKYYELFTSVVEKKLSKIAS